jgi:ribosomal protein L22
LKQSLQGAKAYYELKGVVGLFESQAMKSALEMSSRKIWKIEQVRHCKIPEPTVDQIAKLVRKGIRNAETRRPTTMRERRLIVEIVLGRMGFWPP